MTDGCASFTKASDAFAFARSRPNGRFCHPRSALMACLLYTSSQSGDISVSWRIIPSKGAASWACLLYTSKMCIRDRVYTTRFGGNPVMALSNVSFSVEAGEYVAIMGESGSGKTTLLNILAALDRPTSGEVLLGGKNILSIREKDISAFRRSNLGFVFQDFNLLDTFSIQDNILLPLVLSGMGYKAVSYTHLGQL